MSDAEPKARADPMSPGTPPITPNEKPAKRLNFDNARHNWPNLASATETSLTVIRPLTEEEAKQYRAARDEVASLVKSQWPIRVLEGNLQALQGFLDWVFDKFKDNRLRVFTDEFHVGANRHIMNFLASAGSFLAFTIREHKRTFGRDSKELSQILAAIEGAKARSFELRLALHLRNFAAHYDLPLGGIKFNSRIDDKGQKIHTAIATFDLGRLLDDPRIDGELKSELQRSVDKLPVMNVLAGSMREILEIQEVATDLRLPRIVGPAQFLQKLAGEIRLGEAQIARIDIVQPGPPRQLRTSFGPLSPVPIAELLDMAKASRENG